MYGRSPRYTKHNGCGTRSLWFHFERRVSRLPLNAPAKRSRLPSKKSAGTALTRSSSPARYPRPDEATSDTSYRCYLRGPDGVGKLTPSGTWGTFNVARAYDTLKRAPASRADVPEYRPRV